MYFTLNSDILFRISQAVDLGLYECLDDHFGWGMSFLPHCLLNTVLIRYHTALVYSLLFFTVNETDGCASVDLPKNTTEIIKQLGHQMDQLIDKSVYIIHVVLDSRPCCPA